MSETHQWVVQITSQQVCSDYTTQSECEINNCYWYATSVYPSGHCWDAPLTTCGYYIRQEDCENLNNGTCYWCNGACQSQPCGVVCIDYITQLECEANYCYWCDGACQATPCDEGIDWIKYVPYAAIGIGVIAVGVALTRRRPPRQYMPPPGGG